jgi:polysaccharide export outer membrane protein
VLAVAVLVASPFAGFSQKAAESGAEARKQAYALGFGDQLTIRAANAPDINEKATRIDPDGNINIPMIGRIHAAGMTVTQLETELSDRLKVYLNDPQVSVDIAEYRSQPVSVFGEVGSPGVQQLAGRKSLIEVLALAGGVRPDAGPKLRITRKIEFGRIPLPGAADDPSGQFNIAEVTLRPLIDAQTPEKDIEIQPYDVISVPRVELVYIGGDVTRAGPVELREANTISIMEALSSTGGVAKTAAPQKARILRMVAGSATRDQIPVDVAKIMSGLEPDTQLKPGDILFIPSASGARSKAATKAIDTVIQLGTTALTYSIIH